MVAPELFLRVGTWGGGTCVSEYAKISVLAGGSLGGDKALDWEIPYAPPPPHNAITGWVKVGIHLKIGFMFDISFYRHITLFSEEGLVMRASRYV